MELHLQDLNSSQSFVYFSKKFLLSSIEARVKYLFPLFSLMYPSTSPIIRCSGFTILIFS